MSSFSSFLDYAEHEWTFLLCPLFSSRFWRLLRPLKPLPTLQASFASIYLSHLSIKGKKGVRTQVVGGKGWKERSQSWMNTWGSPLSNIEVSPFNWMTKRFIVILLLIFFVGGEWHGGAALGRLRGHLRGLALGRRGIGAILDWGEKQQAPGLRENPNSGVQGIFVSFICCFYVIADGTNSIKIVAREIGVSKLESSAQVVVHLIDENDNTPEFLKEEYVVNEFENAQPGTVIAQVLARNSMTNLHRSLT